MKKQELNPNKQIKILATIMIFTGVFVWFLSDSDKRIIQDLIKGIGIFLFIAGIISFHKIKKYSAKS